MIAPATETTSTMVKRGMAKKSALKPLLAQAPTNTIAQAISIEINNFKAENSFLFFIFFAFIIWNILEQITGLAI